ncbi:hypothetical protein BD324DRAFT_643887 [Kockovaella imperatae]|uniref:Senescence domain-containing protein n=1 Tax=Kockovaella imperatae TaxID=4999 RepID=A0A1Y1U6D0_9TREE|nr:hypothetical protein BD324DRAFT_643887 [Kockovaella imperatae]ORX33593.1 hypothetical protein BD324DRAFT_643887 [Kockovaella imperatae]
MTTIADIPAVTATHLPTPTSTPIDLGSGELSLTVLPPNPPTQPLQVLTLTVGSLSWPLLPNTPVRKIQALKEHAVYTFSPAPADGGAALGEVRLNMKSSASQGEWEATEALCAKFEDALKTKKVWDERVLFVNDEYEMAGKTQKGWGETIASAVIGASKTATERLTAYTDKHVAATNPSHPAPPSQAVAEAARNANLKTQTWAEKAEVGALKVGNSIHEGGKKLGSHLPDSIAQAAKPVPDNEKTEFRHQAESAWEQAQIAAQGIASAAAGLATSVSENAHRAVDHNYGKEADSVAHDIGQTGANLGATGFQAHKATSVIIQGANLTTGINETSSVGATSGADDIKK